MRDVAKIMKPFWKVTGFFNRTSWKVSDVQIVRKTCLCISVSLSLCLCVFCVVVVVVVVVVEEGGEEEKGEETNRTIWLLIPAKVSLKNAETEQLYQVKRMIGGIGDMVLSIYSQS